MRTMPVLPITRMRGVTVKRGLYYWWVDIGRGMRRLYGSRCTLRPAVCTVPR